MNIAQNWALKNGFEFVRIPYNSGAGETGGKTGEKGEAKTDATAQGKFG